MDVRYLKRLIKVVEESEISELEIEDGGQRVKIVKSPPSGVQHSANPHIVAPVHAVPVAQESAPQQAAETGGKEEDSNLVEITSPMVGTFYRAPSPGADPFVKEGDKVKLGQTLCILEAMKLMNELECEVPGTIREVCVENAQPVEYGQRLFLIEPEE